MNIMHGDAAARNIVVPSDRSQRPVWIDFRARARDVEGEVSWGVQKRWERNLLTYNIIWECISCSPCQAELDSWCAEHMAWYWSTIDDITEEENEEVDLENKDLEECEAAERSMEASWWAERGGRGFLERNVPARQLVVTSVMDVPFKL